jgi:hypothetical protein
MVSASFSMSLTKRCRHARAGIHRLQLSPELLLTLVASVNTIDVGRIKELIQKNAEKKLLVTILRALKAAYHVKEQLGDATFATVHMDITLGLSPKIAVNFGPEAKELKAA